MESGSTSLRVAIVGLGRIGANYPDADGLPRSHLVAAARTSGVRVTALVDNDKRRLCDVSHRPEAAGSLLLESLDELPAGVADVLIDATASSDRTAVIQRAAACGIPVVILEKPFAATAAQAIELSELIRDSSINVRVNFHRRNDRRHLAIRREIRSLPQVVMASYNKGLKNYGSHLIDLILHWMGPVAEVRANNPWSMGLDPTVGFNLRFADGRQGTVTALPGVTWDVFEVAFFGNFGRVDLLNGGASIELRRPVRDLIYPDYIHLERDVSASTSGAVTGLFELYCALHDYITVKGDLPGTTVDEALHGTLILDAIERSARTDGDWQRVSPPPKAI
jgi:predicted dehydrogenase